jgi:hypothetical protein
MMTLAQFDWRLLDDPKFKEDSVREEIVVPILTALGYSASGPYLIHRSRALKHPFVYLGSKPHKIEIIPDYIFEVKGHLRWVLDAKAPSEDVRRGKGPQQAYSYAMHPDVRVSLFALCNGRRFTAFEISRLDPFLDFELPDLHTYWPKLAARLAPETFNNQAEVMVPDLGLHLRRLGLQPGRKMKFPLMCIETVSRISDTHYTFAAGFDSDKSTFCGSFDFKADLLPAFMEFIDDRVRHLVSYQLSHSPFRADLRGIRPELSLVCRLSDRIENNHDFTEQFSPFDIEHFGM